MSAHCDRRLVIAVTYKILSEWRLCRAIRARLKPFRPGHDDIRYHQVNRQVGIQDIKRHGAAARGDYAVPTGSEDR